MHTLSLRQSIQEASVRPATNADDDAGELPPLRSLVHDLRNLFGVVASARALLSRPIDDPTKSLILEGLERVATDGGALTTALLAGGALAGPGMADAAEELIAIGPVVRTLAGPDVRIDLEVDAGPARIRMAPADFEAILLELLANARAAGARHIRMRAGVRGTHFWALLADDGVGFQAARVRKSSELRHTGGAHGTGLKRIAAASRSAGGRFQIRSTPGRGSVIALVLPVERTAGIHSASSGQESGTGWRYSTF